MMPVVRISDAAFGDLAVLSKWLQTETPSETIDKIIKNTMERLGLEKDGLDIEAADGSIGLNQSIGLSFTKVNGASVNRIALRSPNWASVLNATLHVLKRRGFDGERLVSELNIPAKNEAYEDEGYRYYSDLGISYQGQSAEGAWKEIERLAKKWQIPVHIKMEWRDNPKAQFPGKTGELKAG